MFKTFHWNVCWNVFKIHIQMLSDKYFDMIYKKWHENYNTCMVKHRPLMYNAKKTFEILRSEITF